MCRIAIVIAMMATAGGAVLAGLAGFRTLSNFDAATEPTCASIHYLLRVVRLAHISMSTGAIVLLVLSHVGRTLVRYGIVWHVVGGCCTNPMHTWITIIRWSFILLWLVATATVVLAHLSMQLCSVAAPSPPYPLFLGISDGLLATAAVAALAVACTPTPTPAPAPPTH
jgi:hypothetical protein